MYASMRGWEANGGNLRYETVEIFKNDAPVLSCIGLVVYPTATFLKKA